MKAWKLLLLVPVVAAFAMTPQDPAQEAKPVDKTSVASISELRYITPQGEMVSVPAKSVVEIRLLEDATDRIRLELIYENADYSLVDVQAFHLLRSGASAREVRFVRSKKDLMRFPRLP